MRSLEGGEDFLPLISPGLLSQLYCKEEQATGHFVPSCLRSVLCPCFFLIAGCCLDSMIEVEVVSAEGEEEREEEGSFSALLKRQRGEREKQGEGGGQERMMNRGRGILLGRIDCCLHGFHLHCIEVRRRNKNSGLFFVFLSLLSSLFLFSAPLSLSFSSPPPSSSCMHLPFDRCFSLFSMQDFLSLSSSFFLSFFLSLPRNLLVFFPSSLFSIDSSLSIFNLSVYL